MADPVEPLSEADNGAITKKKRKKRIMICS
jgi:hypothetical protein